MASHYLSCNSHIQVSMGKLIDSEGLSCILKLLDVVATRISLPINEKLN